MTATALGARTFNFFWPQEPARRGAEVQCRKVVVGYEQPVDPLDLPSLADVEAASIRTR